MATVESRASARPITDLRRDDIGFAGGKGTNLGELPLAGFPVPPGFVNQPRRLIDAADRRMLLQAARGRAGQ